MRRTTTLLTALALLAPVPLWGVEDDHHGVDFEARAEREAAPDAVSATQGDSAFAVRITENNLIEMTITNYGFFGNNFASTKASLVYPKGANPVLEHMVRAGIWVGAKAQDPSGRFLGVVTGAIDGTQGSNASGSTEWTPIGKDIQVRSILPSSKYFDPAAVSEEDLLCAFDDRVVRRSDFNRESHRPMGVEVTQESFAWAFADYANCVFLRFKIRNTGAIKESLWVAFYNEFASGNKTVYTDRNIWPPSSTGSVVGGWYTKKWIAYDDSLRLYREHYCLTQPVPDGCNLEFVPAWIGVRLLGWKGLADDTTTRRVTMQAWSYNPNSPARRTDSLRYEVLSTGLINPLEGDSLLPTTGDPVGILGVGPFPVVFSDSVITVDFAIVGGREIEDIQEHSRVAQRAYDRGYIIPIPPPSPRMKAVARDGSIDLYWDDLAEQSEDPTSPQPKDWEGYRVYFGDEPLELRRTAQFDNRFAPGDTTGFNTGVESVRLDPPVVLDGVTYHYRYTIPSVRNGFRYFCSVTAYDLGNNEVEPLESSTQQNLTLVVPGPAAGERPSGGVTVYPNPYRVEAAWDAGRGIRDHYLWFANLPPQCTIRIFTLAGDLVFQREFDGSTYQGEGTRGLYDPRQPVAPQPPTLSGTSFAWNLITDEGQAIATGLYLYSVESPGGGREVGKFLVVKSDRE
jgi:hypothetical protein